LLTTLAFKCIFFVFVEATVIFWNMLCVVHASAAQLKKYQRQWKKFLEGTEQMTDSLAVLTG